MATTTMREVDTAAVSGRREVHYNSFDEIAADAERLLHGGYTQLGNWNLGTMSSHLAKAMQTGLDGFPVKINPVVRFLARMLLKGKTLKKMNPGFKLPKKAASLAAHVDEDRAGVAELKAMIERWKREPQRQAHAFFGKLTGDEWNTLMLRHAEMHMSFLVSKT
jgi:Protein of unknown function (DUF1569)